MKIIELWGSGIPRVINEFKNYGLKEPEFMDFDGDFRINLYRNNGTKVGTDVTKVGTDGTNGEGYIEIMIKLIRENPKITQTQMASELGISLRNIKRLMSELQKKNIIKRVGSNRSGKWEVI